MDPQAQWREENVVLAEIGLALHQRDTRVGVLLPTALADRAVQAWERDGCPLSPDGETHQARLVRQRAGTLALIGLAVSERGVRDEEGVAVVLDAWAIGLALECADDHGLIVGPSVVSDPRAPSFINVDLDISSRSSLVALARGLEPRGILLLDQIDQGIHRLCFELAHQPTSIRAAITEMIDAISTLPALAQAAWHEAEARAFNIGIEAGSPIHQPVIELGADLVTLVNTNGAGLTITHYPNSLVYRQFQHEFIH